MKSTKISQIIILLFAIFIAACTEDSLPGTEPVDPNTGTDTGMDTTSSGEAIIWTGSTITFTKANGADPSTNQDQLTSKVALTRGNNGGQIYNAVEESSASKSASPRGTQWAIGTLDNIDDLEFRNFRAAVGSPQSVVGKDLVLHLVEDNIYLSVRFTSWSQSKGGGFSYQRSTAP